MQPGEVSNVLSRMTLATFQTTRLDFSLSNVRRSTSLRNRSLRDHNHQLEAELCSPLSTRIRMLYAVDQTTPHSVVPKAFLHNRFDALHSFTSFNQFLSSTDVAARRCTSADMTMLPMYRIGKFRRYISATFAHKSDTLFQMHCNAF